MQQGLKKILNLNNMKHKKIGIIGLGYVGLPLAIEFGKKYDVIGFDINKDRVNELGNGYDRTLEVNADDFKTSLGLHFSFNQSDLVDCNFFIITVPTPINKANRPDLTPLIKASETVGKVLKKGDIVIYESTVYPGATEEICIPVLESFSNLKFNADFFCGYSPERINPGDKVNTLVTIKKITSGSTPAIADEVDNLYNSILNAGTYKASSIKVAEAAKVIENSQRDLNIAFVNELSVIFERIGIDTIEVLEAAASKWNFLPFRPGMVGGHCIGVDPYYLTHKAEEVGYNPQVILAGRRINDNMAKYAARTIIKRMVKNGIEISKSNVTVMGVTFKENCPDIRNSKVFDLVKELLDWNVNVTLYDPWADKEEVFKEYGILLVDELEDGKADTVILAVNHLIFRNTPISEIRKHCKLNINPVLGDLKGIYNSKEITDNGFSGFRF
jgi:UDP-N-acetyl-D-galactosamine dehydrogenase